MYTLRKITGEGIQINLQLGESYTYVHREWNFDEFCKMFESYFERKHVADFDETSDFDTKNCYAFVINDSFVQPLYKNQKSFIMTESGKTFDNLSYK